MSPGVLNNSSTVGTPPDLRRKPYDNGGVRRPLVGSIVQGFFGGNSPWVYEVIYVNRAKLLVSNRGIATSAEMAEMAYQVDYYIHVDTREAALDLITHLPFNGHVIDTREIADYAGPAIEQAINQVIQVTKLEHINERIHWSVLKKLGQPCTMLGRPNTPYKPSNVPVNIPPDKVAAITREEQAIWSSVPVGTKFSLSSYST